jgi:dienelactone hydrolase
VLGIGALVTRASDGRDTRSAPTPSSSTAAPTTTTPPTTVPPVIVASTPPAGANVPGTSEWYTAPAPDGRLVTLGVYRPVGRPRGTVLIVTGHDGMRRQYEDLAARFAAADHLIAVVGCWFDERGSARMPDAIDCPYGPDFKGISTASVADLDALVTATHDVPGVDRNPLVMVGHSVGASAALVRAGLEPSSEPVVSSAGLLAPTPGSSPFDLYAIDYAGTIRVPVFVIHGSADPICPLAQAEAFVAALGAAGNPPKTLFLDTPANHSIPFQGEACADEPGVALEDRFVREVVDWTATLPSPDGRH